MSLTQKLILVFKIISIVGFIATGVLILGVLYKGYRIFLKNDEEYIKKYRWVFVIIAVLTISLLVYIYTLLF